MAAVLISTHLFDLIARCRFLVQYILLLDNPNFMEHCGPLQTCAKAADQVVYRPSSAQQVVDEALSATSARVWHSVPA